MTSNNNWPVKEKTVNNDQVINNCYRITTTTIAVGSYSIIRIVQHVQTGELYAAKLEKRTLNKLPQLHIEEKIYRKINQNKIGFPAIYYFGKWNNFNILIMQLLGKNLAEVFELCGKQFGPKSILHIALQLLDRFEYLHNLSIIFRDVKLENFLLGLGKDIDTIYVCDFGLSKIETIIDNDNNSNANTNDIDPLYRPLIGDIRFMSLNVHRGEEATKRDDIESIGYVLLYLLKHGQLPWIEVKKASDETMRDYYKRIYQYKFAIPIERLCHGFQAQYADFLRYARRLESDEPVDYNYLRKLFQILYKQEQYIKDCLFDWTNRFDCHRPYGKVHGQWNEFIQQNNNQTKQNKSIN